MNDSETELRDMFYDLEDDIYEEMVEAIKAGIKQEAWQAGIEAQKPKMRAGMKQAIARCLPAANSEARLYLEDSYRRAYNNPTWERLAREKMLPGLNDLTRTRPGVSPKIRDALNNWSDDGERTEDRPVLDLSNYRPYPNVPNRINSDWHALTAYKPGIDSRLTKLINETGETVQKLSGPILTQMDVTLDDIIRKTEQRYRNGNIKLETAISKISQEASERGIQAITYKNGRRVDIASWGEMALRTGAHRAQLLAEGKRRSDMGESLVIASMRASTCDECAKWQGMIFIDDVFTAGASSYDTGKYPKLSEAMNDGFLHPNCRHTVRTYIPGITNKPDVVDPNDAEKLYRAEQKQRRLEREIRKAKRASKASITRKDKHEADSRVYRLQAQLREHLSKNSELQRERWREQLL